MATSRKTQAKAGIAEKRRGQQMGDERSKPSKTEEAQREAPALGGRRKTVSKLHGDDPARRRDTSGKSPRSISPSVPAAIPTGVKQGESGGEAEFKARQKAASKGAGAASRKARK